jgi:hypothetical protein
MRSSARRAIGAALLVLTLVFALHSPVSAAKSPQYPRLTRQQLIALVNKYAAKYGIPQSIAHSLVEVESGWRQNAVSYAGARGIMQLMPRTARDLGVNRRDPKQNIEGGMRYLRQLYNRFRSWDLALAAYHSGPRNVVRHRGVPPASRSYVRRILRKSGAVASAAPAHRTVRAAAAKAATPPAFEKRQFVTVSGQTTTTIRESLRNGQVVWRAEETVTLQGDVRIYMTREYRLIEGTLTLVKEQSIAYTVESVPELVKNEEK